VVPLLSWRCGPGIRPFQTCLPSSSPCSRTMRGQKQNHTHSHPFPLFFFFCLFHSSRSPFWLCRLLTESLSTVKAFEGRWLVATHDHGVGVWRISEGQDASGRRKVQYCHDVLTGPDSRPFVDMRGSVMVTGDENVGTLQIFDAFSWTPQHSPFAIITPNRDT